MADEEVDLKKHKENMKKKEQSHAYTGNQVIIIHYRKRASTRTHRTAWIRREQKWKIAKKWNSWRKRFRRLARLYYFALINVTCLPLSIEPFVNALPFCRWFFVFLILLYLYKPFLVVWIALGRKPKLLFLKSNFRARHQTRAKPRERKKKKHNRTPKNVVLINDRRKCMSKIGK